MVDSPVLDEHSQLLEDQEEEEMVDKEHPPRQQLDALLAAGGGADSIMDLFKSNPLLARDLITSGREWPEKSIITLATGTSLSFLCIF
jgi:hypothetical protein